MQVAPERFTEAVRQLVQDAGNTLFLSAASSWEIAIKYALGRLPLPVPPSEYVPERIRRGRVVPLPIQHVHALHVATLPPHHRDPFDHLLIAQAQLEKLTILTSDRQFAAYDVRIHWARR